ncbi:MAG: PepSY domain-containing protein [Clostridia bacterium]|nr:PepSY domain-containing protein [Clostridia bacterium]
MKKNLKKLSSLALAFILVLALSVTAVAADISSDEAKSIALGDAGFSAAQVSYLNVKTDYENGIKAFDVSFIAFNADGSFTEYDYEIKAADGRILERDIDLERGKSNQVPINGSNDIGPEQAKRIALGHFGVKAEEVKFLEVRKDYDDGRSVYEIEFCRPYSEKYSCEVSVSNGLVRDAEREAVRGIFDKLELFFELLILAIIGR